MFKKIIPYALCALAGAGLVAILGWALVVLPLTSRAGEASLRADAERTRADAVAVELTASRSTVDAIGKQLADARRSSGELGNALANARADLGRLESRNRELEKQLGELRGLAGEIGSGLVGDADLARRSHDAVRGALEILGILPGGDAKASEGPGS